MLSLHLAAATGWDHGYRAQAFDFGHDGSRVIALVGQYSLGLTAFQQRQGFGVFGCLACGQTEGDGLAQAVGQQVDLGAQSTSGTPQSLVFGAPFCGPWPLADGLARWSNPASGKDSYRPQPDRQTDGSKPPPRPSARITCARSCTCHTAPACPPSASPSAPPKAPHSQTAGYPLPDDPPSRPPRQKRLHSPPLRLRQLIPCRCHTLLQQLRPQSGSEYVDTA